MSATHFIKSEADRCVKCGMCLPHCPTYTQARDEGDSPRGRIALMQGLVDGRLQPSDRLRYHLERCLGCRACERVCPSGVRFGRLMDAAMGLIAQGGGHRPSWETLVSDRKRLRRAARLLRFVQCSGLRRLARASGLLHLLGVARAEALLPEIKALSAWRTQYPPLGKQRGTVALFTGCIADVADQPTTRSAIRLLTHFGYAVRIPAAQQCCGALALHGGDHARARRLAAANIAAFGTGGIDALIYTATGCGATLREYPDLLADSRKAGDHGDSGFMLPVVEICTFLDQIPWPQELALGPLRRRIVVHDPCSLSYVTGGAGAVYRLLERIPGAEIRPLAGNARCCGAGGGYALRQPAMADSLRTDKLVALRESGADVLATTNIGCALHLAAGIREAALGMEVLHPLVLLEKQMQVTPHR